MRPNETTLPLAWLLFPLALLGGERSAEAMAARARSVLSEALATETGFVKVHAAEALIALGDLENPRRVFAAELPAAAEARPYRIGVWRVLALASLSETERTGWISKIETVARDTDATDQLHAIETLGKLGHAPAGAVLAAIESYAREAQPAARIFAWWVLHHAGRPDALPAIVGALDSPDPAAVARAAYVLQRIERGGAVEGEAVARAAQRMPSFAPGYPQVLGAALVHGDDEEKKREWRDALKKLIATAPPAVRYQACLALLPHWDAVEAGLFEPLLAHPDGDVRIAASWTILHVHARK